MALQDAPGTTRNADYVSLDQASISYMQGQEMLIPALILRALNTGKPIPFSLQAVLGTLVSQNPNLNKSMVEQELFEVLNMVSSEMSGLYKGIRTLAGNVSNTSNIAVKGSDLIAYKEAVISNKISYSPNGVEQIAATLTDQDAAYSLGTSRLAKRSPVATAILTNKKIRFAIDRVSLQDAIYGKNGLRALARSFNARGTGVPSADDIQYFGENVLVKEGSASILKAFGEADKVYFDGLCTAIQNTTTNDATAINGIKPSEYTNTKRQIIGKDGGGNRLNDVENIIAKLAKVPATKKAIIFCGTTAYDALLDKYKASVSSNLRFTSADVGQENAGIRKMFQFNPFSLDEIGAGNVYIHSMDGASAGNAERIIAIMPGDFKLIIARDAGGGLIFGLFGDGSTSKPSDTHSTMEMALGFSIGTQAHLKNSSCITTGA